MADTPAPMPRAALITGASQRIGATIARALAADGWAVAVHYRGSAEEADKLVEDIKAAGGRAAAVQADLADEDETASLVSRAAAAVGTLGVLVNNASLFERDEVMDVTRESWDSHMAVNLRAPFVLSQAFARQLPKDAGGAVINMLDQRVNNLTPHFTSYTLSKSGLWTLTRTLALALAPRIRVNGIGPGPTMQSPRQTAEQFRAQARATPLQRAINPSEIADTVRFLLAAPSVTGQMIAVDSGQHLHWAPPPSSGPIEE